MIILVVCSILIIPQVVCFLKFKLKFFQISLITALYFTLFAVISIFVHMITLDQMNFVHILPLLYKPFSKNSWLIITLVFIILSCISFICYLVSTIIKVKRGDSNDLKTKDN